MLPWGLSVLELGEVATDRIHFMQIDARPVYHLKYDVELLDMIMSYEGALSS